MFFHSPADTKVSHINHFRGSALIQVFFIFIDSCKRIDSKTEYSFRKEQFWISYSDFEYPIISQSVSPPPYKLAVSDFLSEIFSPGSEAWTGSEWSHGSGHVSRNQFAQ